MIPPYKKIVLATHNIDKQKELESLLKTIDITTIGMDHFPEIGTIEETGLTLLENSLIKAHEVHQATGLPSLADDTGLEVDFLNGAPGVYSARFAGVNATYQDNVKKLLFKLKGVPIDLRKARFRTVISYVEEGIEFSEEGFIEGAITIEEKGEKGFGYDSIFQPEYSENTFAQMSALDKNLKSHRAKAFNKMRKTLNKFFKNGGSIE